MIFVAVDDVTVASDCALALRSCPHVCMEEEPGRGSECLLNQHFFDSVALENSGVA